MATPGVVRYVAAENPSPTTPFLSWDAAATNIQDAIDVAEAGDEVLVTNGVYACGGRAIHGELTNRVAIYKALLLRSVNGPEDTVIQGFQLPVTTNGTGAVRCVYLTNGASLSGFTLRQGGTRVWPALQLTEQSGGGVWCESTNAWITDCRIINNAAVIFGGGVYRGTLSHCTLTGNSVGGGGGAAYGSLLDHCLVTGNFAGEKGGGAADSWVVDSSLVNNFANTGGGAFFGALRRCVLTGNRAGGGGGAVFAELQACVISNNWSDTSGGGVDSCDLTDSVLIANHAAQGGGAFGGSLANCTVVANSASDMGGGTYYSSLRNCIVYSNTADGGGSNFLGGSLQYACTVPLPAVGVGNFTNAPRFLDGALGNLRLQSNSPCINAGADELALGTTDLDGLSRRVNRTVDLGAYEFQGAGSLLPYVWLQRYDLPTDGSADCADSDGDGHTAWQEWRAGTDPTNFASALRLFVSATESHTLALSWPSFTNRTYRVERITAYSMPPVFMTVRTNIEGRSGMTSFVDTNAGVPGVVLYRVAIQE